MNCLPGRQVVAMIVMIAAAAWCQESARSPALVKLGSVKGSIFRYELKESTKTVTKDVVQEAESTRRFDLTIVDTAPNGGAKVEYRVTSAQAIFTRSSDEPFKVESATRPPANEDANRRLLRALALADVDHPLILTLDHRAEVVGVRGLEETRTWVFSDAAGIAESMQPLIEPWFTEQHYREVMQKMIVPHPPSGAVSGDSWVPNVGIHYCPGLGGPCELIPTTWRITTVTSNELVVESKAGDGATTRKVEDYKRATIATARARISRSDGFPLDVTITTESVSQIPLAKGELRPVTTSRLSLTRLDSAETRKPK